MKKIHFGYILSGAVAGSVNGLFGAGGGMVLIPLLSITVKPDEQELFPTSVSIMLPICIVSIIMTAVHPGGLPWQESWPYLLGSAVGGIAAGMLAKKLPTLWLHRGLGALILFGGVRYLC